MAPVNRASLIEKSLISEWRMRPAHDSVVTSAQFVMTYAVRRCNPLFLIGGVGDARAVFSSNFNNYWDIPSRSGIE
jgi:hypothetical protein